MPILTVIMSALGVLMIAAQVVIYDQQRRIMNTQVDVSERNLRISERAYVSIASLKADLAQGEIVIMLENLGRLPAAAIQMNADAYLLGNKLDGYNTPFKAGEVKLFPGNFQMRVVINTRKYSSEAITAIREKKQFLYLTGSIQYEDGFGFKDTTRFAFEYNPPPNEGWTPVITPVAEMRETLERKAYSMSLGPLSIVTPSPES